MEVAAELHDTVADDLHKIYPELMPYVRIRVIELQDHVLSTYDREISKYTAQEFSRQSLLPWPVVCLETPPSTDFGKVTLDMALTLGDHIVGRVCQCDSRCADTTE